jgi:hypothetical protein
MSEVYRPDRGSGTGWEWPGGEIRISSTKIEIFRVKIRTPVWS